MLTLLSPKIISGTGMPSFVLNSSIGSALRMGSLRVLTRHCLFRETKVSTPGEAVLLRSPLLLGACIVVVIFAFYVLYARLAHARRIGAVDVHFARRLNEAKRCGGGRWQMRLLPWTALATIVYQHHGVAASLLIFSQVYWTGRHSTTHKGRGREYTNTHSLSHNTFVYIHCIFVTIDMDIQSLEARFEHISVSDENHEHTLAHSKSKVSRNCKRCHMRD